MKYFVMKGGLKFMWQIETDRLKMIPFTLELMQAAIHDKARLAQLLGAEVPAEWPNPDFAEVLPFIAEDLEKNPTRPIWDGLILDKAAGMLVGDMGLKGGPDETGTADMGYSIIPAYQNRGYATEMARGLITWAFGAKGLTRITAECLDDNTGSIRVLEKLGMDRLAPEGNMLKWQISSDQREDK